jgi:hypothetical protein
MTAAARGDSPRAKKRFPKALQFRRNAEERFLKMDLSRICQETMELKLSVISLEE